MSHPPQDPIKDHSHLDPLGIPALVVSGFLGSGKTTLIRHVLRDAQTRGLRLAVVSNEFGELGIDQALLGSEGSGDYIELEGGCVCCKLSDELLATLQELKERVHPDRVIVETSGVALPFETLMNFWREPVSGWVGESLAVVVVNAEQVLEERDLVGTFEQQVSSADLLVLNKTDLVPGTRLGQIEAVLDGMAPGTPIVRSVNGIVDTALLFPPNAGEKQAHRALSADDSLPHTHEAFESEVLKMEEILEPDAFLEQFKQHKALRIKGVVQTVSGLRIVQGVGSRIDLMPPTCDLPSHLIGQVVIIRRGQEEPSTHRH